MRERRSRAEANRTGDQATGGSGANATRGVATSSGGGTSGGGGGGGGQANQSQSQGGGSGQQQQATGKHCSRPYHCDVINF